MNSLNSVFICIRLHTVALHSAARLVRPGCKPPQAGLRCRSSRTPLPKLLDPCLRASAHRCAPAGTAEARRCAPVRSGALRCVPRRRASARHCAPPALRPDAYAAGGLRNPPRPRGEGGGLDTARALRRGGGGAARGAGVGVGGDHCRDDFVRSYF